MKKTVVYTLDALNPELINDIALSDIQNTDIKQIIIPNFVLKKAYVTYDTQSLKQVVNELQNSSKMIIRDFAVLHEGNPNSIFSFFIMFMLQVSKEYKNLYIRTRDHKIMIECLKRGFKIFSDKEYYSIFNYINKENTIKPKSNVVFIDTCYYINIFYSHNGLNIIKDNNVKKIIFSCILEELLKIKEIEVLEFLIFLINNKKEFNIKFLTTADAYSKPYCCNDLMMLSHVMQLKNCKAYSDLTVYTADLEFAIQCIGLNIKVADIGKTNTEILADRNKKGLEIIDSNDFFKGIPILIKKGIIYISAKDAPIVYKDLAAGTFSDMFFEKGVRYFKIKLGWHVKLVNKEKSRVYRISKIDKNLSVAYIEKTSLVL